MTSTQVRAGTERWPLFDLMRVAAAGTVVLCHASVFTGGSVTWLFNTPDRDYYAGSLAVGVFFVLSGWLITASWGRNRVGVFALRRAARIMPGLLAAVAFSVVIGLVVTSWSPWAYLSDGQTWRFVGNNVALRPMGEPHLPGVFGANPYPGTVNGSLWTLPHEVLSYVVVAGLGVAGLLTRRWVLLATGAALVAVQAGPSYGAIGATGLLWNDLAALGAWFLLGALAYLWRDRLIWSPLAAALALGVAVAGNGTALVLPAVAYLVLYLGTRPSHLRLPRWMGDPSYGMYVYAFPIQQALWVAAPGLSAGAAALVALALVTAAGVISWRLIERPAMRAARSRPELDHPHRRTIRTGAEGGVRPLLVEHVHLDVVTSSQ